MSDDSPNAHRLVLELVESTQDERFIDTMLTKFSTSELESMDEILSCLGTAFSSYVSPQEQLQVLRMTNHAQLRSIWLDNLDS